MLPQFGFTEFLLIAVIALIVVGPKDLPMMMRKLGQFVAKGKSMAREFQSAFDDIARQAELDELRKEIEDLRRDNALTEAVDDLKKTEADINRSVMMQKPKKTGDEPAASENQDMTTPEETPELEAPVEAPKGIAKDAPAPASKEAGTGTSDPSASKKAQTS